jgi:hypothetical protein
MKHRSVVIEARAIVLIAVIVVARKLILVDFKSATFEQIASYGGIALALGILFWLLGAKAKDQNLIFYALLLVVILVRPSGVFGTAAETRGISSLIPVWLAARLPMRLR